MRVRKASINVIISVLTFLIGLLPSFFVRKAFLDSLGNELLGLSSLYSSIIGLLSIVELGIGSAIIYSLYKPFAENDREKIKGYIVYYKKFYRIIGCIILGLGLLTIPFLDMLVKDEINLLDAKIYFILFLINTFISYLFSYNLCVLTAAQEEYKLAIGTSVSKLVISFIQYVLLVTYPNFIAFILIQIFVNIIYYLFMNYYINNNYKWLARTKGYISIDERKSLTVNIKAIFFHKLGGVFVFGTDNLLISYFISLTIVGIFNSYYMVIGAIQAIISNALTAITASIGNLLTEGNLENAFQVHKRLFFLSFWVVSFVTISLFNTIDQFIILWLGKSQLLDNFTISIILINFYFLLMRGSVERFKDGGGIFYQDRYAPVIESSINLVVSIILVKLLGLPGVFLGTLISNLTVVFWVKPKMVYKYIFKKSLKLYFKMYFKYLILGLIPLLITNFILIPIRDLDNLGAFILNCLINVVVINVIYLKLFWKNAEFRYFKNLIINVYKSKNQDRNYSKKFG